MDDNFGNKTLNGNNTNDILINFESDIYKIILYIEFQKLIIKLEPENNNPDKTFQNGFILSEIQKWHIIFAGLNTLEVAKEYIEKICKGF